MDNEQMDYLRNSMNNLPQVQNGKYDERYDDRYIQTPQDMIETYGGVIKDLTDTNDFLDRLELKLQGKKIVNQKVIERATGYKLEESEATEFVDMIRSIVNQNTHFSNLPDKVVNNMIMSANNTIVRYMMLKGSKIPLRYRNKIGFEAMNLICTSLHKGNNGTILTWTKGSFSENAPMNNKESKGGIFPWQWGRK